ncbi:ABC transporter permease [Lysinibacillus xylanilyticus]|uniref:ABC transporter permease n=1 Tax=Lysinibacillus xylanilyticus TaxID=582475 RepID=UPI0037F2AF5F
MVDIFFSEFQKLKRKKILVTLLLVMNILPILLAVYFKMLPPNSPVVGNFPSFYKMCLAYMGLLILPIIIGILIAYFFHLEYSNNILKQLLVIPIKKRDIVISKFLVIEVLSIILMLIYALVVIIGGVLIGKFEIPLLSIGRVVLLALGTGVLIPIACSPILIFTSISRSIILPVCVSFVYALIGFMGAESLVSVHTVLNAINIIYYKNTEGLLISGNVIVSIVNLSIITVISITLSILFFKRREE